MRPNATFTSVWDGGLKVNARCCVDIEQKKVLSVNENDYAGDDGDLEILEEEYVILDIEPSKKYPAKNNSEKEDDDSEDTIYYD